MEPSPLHVLLIDDDPGWCLYAKQVLKRGGFASSAANTGAAGVREVRRLLPDVVLCDWDLPDMTGPSVITRLGLDRATAQIPVVIVTADATAGREHEGRAVGAIDVLAKQGVPSEIIRAVSRAVLRAS